LSQNDCTNIIFLWEYSKAPPWKYSASQITLGKIHLPPLNFVHMSLTSPLFFHMTNTTLQLEPSRSVRKKIPNLTTFRLPMEASDLTSYNTQIKCIGFFRSRVLSFPTSVFFVIHFVFLIFVRSYHNLSSAHTFFSDHWITFLG
jgi:hypothetical protein